MSVDACEMFLPPDYIRLSRTVDGIPTTITEPASGTTSPQSGITEPNSASSSAFKTPKGKQRKVLRKIPPEVIAEAKGLCIFTSMRSGIAPFGGAGGTGVVVGRLPDGCESKYLS